MMQMKRLMCIKLSEYAIDIFAIINFTFYTEMLTKRTFIYPKGHHLMSE